jgi:uncharacterized small protein (DUF1192 family)
MAGYFLRFHAGHDNAGVAPVGLREARETAMDEEQVRPKKKAHELGEDLALLSVAELRERVDALRAEIDGWRPQSAQRRRRAAPPTRSSSAKQAPESPFSPWSRLRQKH